MSRRPKPLREQLAAAKAQARTLSRLAQQGQAAPVDYEAIATAILRALPSPPTPPALSPEEIAALPGTHDLEPVPRFVQIATVSRGMYSVLHALDTTGQIWQFKTLMSEKVAGEKATVQAQWWEKIPMERR